MREKYDRRGKEGPKAPKDPALKRKGFYIMRRKQIAGSVQPDGRGIQFIYLDGGRMAMSRMRGCWGCCGRQRVSTSWYTASA